VKPASLPRSDITAVVLAGGRGRRMGGRDKGLLELKGRPLIEYLLDAVSPQVGSIIINANRNQERYAAYDHPVVADTLENFQGPLAGFLCAMAAASTPYLLVLPCDSPFLPADYVSRMARTLLDQQAELAVAHDGKRLQPVYALLPRSLRPSLEAFLAAGDRKIDLWYAQHRMTPVDFSDCPELFRNINTPADQNSLLQEVTR